MGQDWPTGQLTLGISAEKWTAKTIGGWWRKPKHLAWQTQYARGRNERRGEELITENKWVSEIAGRKAIDIYEGTTNQGTIL